MESPLFSISKIFTERILRIPDYQRGYAWKEKQLKDFWTDLIQLEAGKNHYIGVLTLEGVPENTLQKWAEDHWIVKSKNYNPYYVVDGQQRLTTTIILIQAITELIQPDQKLNYTSLIEIRKKFIYDSKDDGISRSYIFGYEKDNPSHEFLKTRIFLETSDNSFSIQETIYTRNLENAKSFFLDKLKELEILEIENIYRKVTQSLLFNIYTISEDIDVYVAFETMNNRGKPLSHLELLKNRLIYLSTKFNEEESEKNQLRHTINEAWKSIYHYLGKNKEKPLDDDRFLFNHFNIYYGNNLIKKRDGKSSLRFVAHRYRDFHEEYLLERIFTTRNINIAKNENGSDEIEPISVKDVYQYVSSLKDSVEIWFQLLNPKDSQFEDDVKIWLEKLNRLEILQYAPLIMVFFQTTKNTNVRVRFLKSLEKFIFLTCLARMASTYIYYASETANFTEMCLQLSEKILTPEGIIKQIEQNVDSLKNIPEFVTQIVTGFRKKGFYEWSGIKYFLYEYELFLKERSKTYRDKIKWDEYIEDRRDYHTIEHIYPQRPRKECWTKQYNKYTDKERTVLRHSLGNLVPLSQPKNSSFQNKCFADKKNGEEPSCIGFSYGSYSENEIAQYQDWTAKEIMERGLKLLSFMEMRWDLNFGNNEQKLELLHLEFVPKRMNMIKTKAGLRNET